MLRLAVAGECCRGVEFRADGWIDPLDVDGLHVGRFALRTPTGNFSDFAVEPLKGKHFKVGHFCGKPNAGFTAVFNIDYERLLAGLG
jgi:hypothetical protein